MFNGLYLKRKEVKLPTIMRLIWLGLTFVNLLVMSSHEVALAQSSSGITSPASGETVMGVVEVRGTAVHPDYLRYELAFLQQDVPGAEWIVFAEGDEQVIDGVLAIWNSTVGREFNTPVFPDGRYQLRLRVVKNDYNYDEYYVTDLLVENDGPTPTPTPDETAVAQTATAAAAPLQPTGSTDSSFQQPTPLPSLTPFPTPTPPPTVVGGTPIAPQSAIDGADGGLLGQLEAAETSRVGAAFWLGIQITAVLFMIAALYYLLRLGGRRLWHIYWTNRDNE
ncbi:hypothetical protein MNBD_CHLOROFLEXI01-628 [hydrothermal vent metagenome]|uniref:Uncharacterized protein n=1 Tax=hydrothermal vent metagenome TaxID=652676 RepID=A0A3B0VIZ7_9ZZZZ